MPTLPGNDRGQGVRNLIVNCTNGQRTNRGTVSNVLRINEDSTLLTSYQLCLTAHRSNLGDEHKESIVCLINTENLN